MGKTKEYKKWCGGNFAIKPLNFYIGFLFNRYNKCVFASITNSTNVIPFCISHFVLIFSLPLSFRTLTLPLSFSHKTGTHTPPPTLSRSHSFSFWFPLCLSFSHRIRALAQRSIFWFLVEPKPSSLSLNELPLASATVEGHSLSFSHSHSLSCCHEITYGSLSLALSEIRDDSGRIWNWRRSGGSILVTVESGDSR